MWLTIIACQLLILSTYFFKGRDLLAGAKKEEYFVQIGLDGKCLVKEMTNENITCLPPNEVPGTSHSDENVVAIMVQITIFALSDKTLDLAIYLIKINWDVILGYQFYCELIKPQIIQNHSQMLFSINFRIPTVSYVSKS